ncbi:FlxA-like family protein [Candidatus Saccharibacteria bacterium]|nr:FlxA-like family protein [Candidatus Saccharibacteria bacterium]
MDLKRSNSNQQRSNGEVETLGPVSMPKKTKRSSKKLAKYLVVIAVLAGLGTSTYLFMQEKDKSTSFNNQINSLNDEVKNLKNQVGLSDDQPEQKAQEQSDLTLPVVVFTPDGVFSNEEKKEITDKVINPLVDYTPDVYVSIDVEIYSQDKFVNGNSDNKYIITTIGKPGKGGTGGFIYGSKTKPLDYWVPDCLDTCQFTDEYKAKYPEVVAKYESTN